MYKYIYILYKYSLLLLFLASMHSWFTWNVKNHYLGFFVSLISIIFIVLHKNLIIISRKRLTACLLFSIAVMIGLKENINAYLGPIFILFPSLIVFLIKEETILFNILNLITNFFAILLPFSLIGFLVSFFIDLPSFGYIEHPSGVYSTYTNYLLFIKSSFYNFRFSSIFLEPGHLGMICSYILFANKFNFKDWRVIVILICSLFTLSLAAYVLILIGYLFMLFIWGRITISKIIISSILIGGGYLFATSYNNGNNYVNEMVISRLQYDEEKGITGNNRVYGSFEDHFEFFIKSRDLWLGIGSHEYRELMDTERFGGAGWKVFLLVNGLFATVFIFLAYLYLGNNLAFDKKYMYLFLLLLSLSFLQRGYPFWTSWILTYYLGIKTSAK